MLSSLDIHVERVLSFIKLKSPLISDSIIDFLGKNCYPHFSVEKMETEKYQDTCPVHKVVPDRTRIVSQGLILTPHSSSHCSEASQEEEGRCTWPWFGLPLTMMLRVLLPVLELLLLAPDFFPTCISILPSPPTSCPNVPRCAASASPGNPVGRQVLSPTLDLLDLNLWGGLSNLSSEFRKLSR